MSSVTGAAHITSTYFGDLRACHGVVTEPAHVAIAVLIGFARVCLDEFCIASSDL
jgi:hypothetical protein